MKTALITGITGQDGSWLADLLLGMDYRVFGLLRRHAVPQTRNIAHLLNHPNLHFVYGDLSDSTSLMGGLCPDALGNQLGAGRTYLDEVYNLAAQSHVGVSFQQPEYTGNVTGLGVTRLLEVLRHKHPQARFYQASSSEMFGSVRQTPQNERTPFDARSPYGAAKIYAFYITKLLREVRDQPMFTCNGILFNHESERRGLNFVTRKITRGAAAIKLGLRNKLMLGNLDARRDWGYAPDYVRAMHMMLQADKPDDYVIATNETHTVREFVERAFEIAGLDWQKYVEIDPQLVRRAEVDVLQGDYSKAKAELGWEPQVRFDRLVEIMVSADIADIERNGLGLEETRQF
jgi:GDPmannose 4,6-dehydratase